jgi:pyrroloquinoline quinone biosynthesis protein B
VCRVGRSNPRLARRRSQSSAAISSDGERWFLLNASPDVREQLACLPGMIPTTVRHAPVEGIALTDAELDHTLGLVLLREARSLELYATPAVRRIVEQDSRLLPVTRAFAEVGTTDMAPEQRCRLKYRDGTASELWITPFPVPAGPPRFASAAEPGHTVGLIIEDGSTGASAAFVPGCGDVDERLTDRLAATDLLLFDGTFWTDDELVTLGISERKAREMDHVPVSGAGGSLEWLSSVSRPLKVYTHINNTNPMLLEGSPERRLVDDAGVTVGADGMSFTL